VREVPTIAEMRKADVIICATGTIDSEGTERPFALEAADEELIRLAVELNPNTIVLVNSGSGIDMSAWNDKAAAVLYGWYPGQNGFEAIADIIVGNVNPSGKLPMTIERSFKDSPAANLVPKNASLSKAKGNPNEKLFHPATYDVHYSEGVFVGYRWYESKNIKPLYPFGFGLSYTSFALNEAKAENSIVAPKKPATVSVTLTNTGKREGAEVVQLYVTENNPTVARPKKELKAFKKVTLAPGAKQVVTFEVNHQDLAFWNEQTHKWQVNPGEYTVSLGTSSADIAAQVAVSVEK
jgi:beta-glucosidase